MINLARTHHNTALLWATISVLGGMGFLSSASAQIRPDATLPINSEVRSEGTIQRILGGTQAGQNLFHSFRQFDLPTGTTAYFDQNPALTNIFARITGGQASTLDGVLRANGATNLFLINPRGILFGPNAQLNVGGSFLATTANSVLFPNGNVFSAMSPPQSAPLLSINRPLGLAFNQQPGTITVQSDLNVQPEKTLSLLGGDVNVRGNLTAPGGRIELGAVDANQQVQLDSSSRGLNYSDVQRFQDIRIDNLAIVDTSGPGGGLINVQGDRITLAEGGRLQSVTLGEIDGGGITVNAATSLEVLGNLSLNSPIDPLIAQRGFFLPQTTTILSTTIGTGQASAIEINTGTLRVTDGAKITAATDGLGPGGNLTITAARSIDVGGETILLGFLPEAVPFTEPVTRNFLIDQTSTSQINARSAFIPKSGPSGNININTGDLTLRDGANLTAGSNFGPGGMITLNATSTVEIVGSSKSGFSTSNVSTASISSNNALDTIIRANKLIIRDGGVITASTFGLGQAGDIQISTTHSVEVLGISRSGLIASQINAGTFGAGDSGDITIDTGKLRIKDGGIIQLSSVAQGQTGSLKVTANSVFLENQSQISSNAVASPAGNLNIDTNLLLLNNGSNITTNAFGLDAGGNISLNADVIVALPLDGDSNITANAFNGPGGQITITTQGLLGIAVSESNTDLNEITAISQNNPQLNGMVDLNTPDADPSENLAEQPDDIESPQPIARGCQTRQFANQSRFKRLGRGGLPISPHSSLSSLAVWQDLRTDPEPLSQVSPSSDLTATLPTDTPVQEITEAQGWQQDDQGRTVLTTQRQGPSHYAFQPSAPNC